MPVIFDNDINKELCFLAKMFVSGGDECLMVIVVVDNFAQASTKVEEMLVEDSVMEDHMGKRLESIEIFPVWKIIR